VSDTIPPEAGMNRITSVRYIYYFNFANASLILEKPFSIFFMLLANEIRIQSLSPKAFPATVET
jgi:hypothetical protein